MEFKLNKTSSNSRAFIALEELKNILGINTLIEENKLLKDKIMVLEDRKPVFEITREDILKTLTTNSGIILPTLNIRLNPNIEKDNSIVEGVVYYNANIKKIRIKTASGWKNL